MMEFKTQICTTEEQSRKLLELGIKPETADMMLYQFKNNVWKVDLYFNQELYSDFPGDYLPAWSLHRLMVIGEQNNISFNNLENAYDSSIALINNDVRFGVLNKKYLNK